MLQADARGVLRYGGKSGLTIGITGPEFIHSNNVKLGRPPFNGVLRITQQFYVVFIQQFSQTLMNRAVR